MPTRSNGAGAIRCLLIEEGHPLRAPIAEALAGARTPFTLAVAADQAAAAAELSGNPPDVILLGVSASLEAARAAVSATVQAAAGAPVLAIGGLATEEADIDLIRHGAQDFLREHPAAIAALPRILRYTVERRRMSDRTARAVSRRKDLESLLTTIMSVADIPLLIATDAGAIVSANPAFTRSFGWTMSSPGLPLLSGLTKHQDAAEPSDDEALIVSVRCFDGRTIQATQRRGVTSMDGRPWHIVSLIPTAMEEEDVDTAARLLAGMTGGEGTFVAGRLQLIGLDEIRQKLGNAWERWSERAYALAEKVIRSRITEQDVFAKNKAGDFIICFASLSGDDAWYKAQAISREIREKLIGDSEEGEIADIRLEAHTVSVRREEVEDEPDIAALLSKKLDRQAARVRENQARLLRELYEQAVLAPNRVFTASGALVPAVVGDLDPASTGRLDSLRHACGDGDQLLTDIDLLVLDRSVEYVGRALERRDKRLVIVPVHYATLQSQKGRETYMRTCRKLPEAMRHLIGFRVMEIGEHVHGGRVCDLIGQLRNFARLRMLQLSKADLMGINLRDAGVSVVCMRHDAVSAALRNRPAALEALVREVQMQRARLAVTYLPDQASARRAVEQGATMLTFDPARSPQGLRDR